MGVIVEEQEFTCSIPPTRLFKAYILDSHNLLPKILPTVFKSIKITEGNGGAGSIMVITFQEGGNTMTVKHKIEEVDEANHVYKFKVIEGDVMGDDFESVLTVIKIEAGPNGGSTYKTITEYHTKGDNHNAIQEKIKKGKEGVKAFLQTVEAHLHSNPNEYK